ncbi:hypothetical protein [Methylocystis sp.]|uniref:hypothetical protein n=1 Tax=Methylocystis sp. TaxID=1911079 RepID=UPI003DA220E8
MGQETMAKNSSELRWKMWRLPSEDWPPLRLFKDIEAQEYHEALAKRKAALLAIDVAPSNAFPDEGQASASH